MSEIKGPLKAACARGNLSMVRSLVEHGADRDSGIHTPLALAVIHHHESIVSALLNEFGCDPNGVSSM